MKIRTAQKGFTLIELLVVIGILAILFSIVLIAINPARQFGQANDTKKRSDTLQILNAIHQYAAGNGGQLPPVLATASAIIDFDNAEAAPLCQDLLTTYISAIPVAPEVINGLAKAGTPITDCNGTWDTGYNIEVATASGRVTVSADENDVNSQPITITR